MDMVLKITTALAALLVVLSLFSGLSWPLKIRILAVALLGMVVLGVWAWPLVAPAELFAVVSIPSVTNALVLMILALATGFIGYFITWPYGAHLGVIAVPTGMAVWAIRSASIADALMGTTEPVQRANFFHALIPEPFFWLLIAGIGLVGVFLARFALSPAASEQAVFSRPKLSLTGPAAAATSLLASAVIAFFAVTLLAQNIKFPDAKLDYVIVQPSAGQIGFAVFVSFALASFVARQLVDAPYFWSAAATALVSIFGLVFYSRTEILDNMAATWPANFFANCHSSILPVQMVSFGILGAVAGFWLVQAFEIWRHSQIQLDQ